MTEQQYYGAIEQYNQVIADLQFSPFTHTKDEVFVLQDSIRREAKQILARVNAKMVHRSQQGFSQVYLDELDMRIMRLRRMLQDLDYTDRPLTDYEGTYESDPYRYLGFVAVAFLLGFLVVYFI